MTLLNRLPTERAVQVLGDVDLDTAAFLVRAWDNPDAAVDVGDVQAVIARYSDLDATAQQQFARVFADAADEPAMRFVQSLDAAALRRFVALADEVPHQRLARFVTRTGEEGADYLAEFRQEADLETFFSFDVGGADNGGLRANLVDVSAEGFPITEARQFVADIDTLADETGIRRLVDQAAKAEAGELRGYTSEARFATTKLEGGADILEIERPTSGVQRPGDLDVVTREDGLEIAYEVKGTSTRQSLGRIKQGIEQLQSEGEIGAFRVIFRREQSASLKEFMNEKDIPFSIRPDI